MSGVVDGGNPTGAKLAKGDRVEIVGAADYNGLHGIVAWTERGEHIGVWLDSQQMATTDLPRTFLRSEVIREVPELARLAPPDPPVAVPGPEEAVECTACGMPSYSGHVCARKTPGPASVSPAEPSNIDGGRAPARTMRQIASAVRQDTAGIGARLYSLRLILKGESVYGPVDASSEAREALTDALDGLSGHLKRAEAKLKLAIEAENAERERSVPLYQPGDTKLLRLTLTAEQWWTLSERMCAPNVAPRTLEEFVTEIVREEANRGR